MSTGVVVIGRNEGERLRRCLDSVCKTTSQVVYVDSGSTDNSVAMADARGVHVVNLDMSIPFCAARARNAGYERMQQSYPQLQYVQFIDGDCEIEDDWLPAAALALEGMPQSAIVTGWLHEKFPEASIYNRLGDLEWNFAGVGETDSVGGIFLIRCRAFDEVGGFDQTVPAGEEPELCQRLIQRGWKIMRLDRNMALHDLAMFHFRQWWKRMIRFGYGSMDVAARFGLARFCRYNRKVRWWLAWLFSALVCTSLALTCNALGIYFFVFSLVLIMMLPGQYCRITYKTMRRGHSFRIAAAYAFFTVINFMPQAVGHALYWNDRLRKRSFRLVEYKAASACHTNGEASTDAE